VLLQCNSKQPNLLQQNNISRKSGDTVVVILVKIIDEEPEKVIYEVSVETSKCDKMNKLRIIKESKTSVKIN
jgi:hypothetical protein